MKSEKINSDIDEFWAWFRGVSKQLASDEGNPKILEALDTHIRRLSPELSWEIGPGLLNPRQLVISPDLDRGRRESARAIVSRAPVVEDWEFHAARQPKEWDYKFELTREGQPVHIDASGWTFVLLRYPDGLREILLKGSNLSYLTKDEKWQAALIVLESILGEDIIIDGIDEFELVDYLEPRFAAMERPIQQLDEAIIRP